MAFSRRAFLAGISASPLIGRLAYAAERVVKTQSGLVSGIPTAVRGVTAWLGIPFAAPPVGELRWRPPAPPLSWSGVRRADHYGNSPCASPAEPNSIYYHPPSSMGEDCLTLNVWAPKPSGKPRPVMVWIYGGAFVAGTTDNPFYDGANLAGQDVVFVSVNYRVGILGFYAHPDLSKESPNGVSGNYGLMDQTAALRWVRDNIAAFGGDPENVTIFGQSAGSFSVGYHLVMPDSKGLFHRAIAESGAPMGKPSSFNMVGVKAEMEAAGLDFAREVSASGIAAMRQMDPMRLVEANSHAWRFYPMIDGALIPDHPFTLIEQGRHAAVPLIAGRNRDEGSVFPPLGNGNPEELSAALAETYGAETEAARRLYAAHDATEAAHQGRLVFADIIFNWNSAALAAVMAKSGRAPVYSYYFSYTGAVPPDAKFAEGIGRDLGAFHGAEITFALRTQAERGPLSAEQKLLMERVSGYWLNLARKGDPNGQGLPNWPRHIPGQPTILHIDAKTALPGPLDDHERMELLGRAMGNRILEV